VVSDEPGKRRAVTRRQLGFLFGVLAALSAVWLSVRDRSSSTGESLDLGSQIELSVSEIRITPPDAPVIRLQLAAEGWTVNGYPATDSLVEDLLAQLDTLPKARLVAQNPATHERMGVAAEMAIRVELGPATDPDAVLLLGGSGPEGRFIRLPDQPEVFVVPESAIQDLGRAELRWRDPTIVAVDTAALARIVIRRGSSRPVAVSRDETRAWLVDGTAADTMVMRLLLESVADLRTTGFPADSFVFAVDFDQPSAILELYVESGLPNTPPVSLLFASIPTRSDVLVRRADNPIVYAIDSRRANLLTSGRSRLIGQE